MKMRIRKRFNTVNTSVPIIRTTEIPADIPIPGPALPSEIIITIPETITVHLGEPDEDAENVTVNFIDYIKNVASSELYPTWPEDAIRANIYAIVSIALNRVFTEWYRGRGYPFDITNSTQYDQSYVHNRGIFDSISVIADELFNDYIRRAGTYAPLFAQYCDGRVSQCDGMYQWGSVDLAEQGYTPFEILQYYYGDNIEIVMDAPVGSVKASYPGTPLQLGDSGFNVIRFQHSLNRISVNFPAIPKIIPIDGFFGETTQQAVMAFQRIFQLEPTGIVNNGTWYSIRNIYNAVAKIGELYSEDLTFSELESLFSGIIFEDDILPRVDLLQYFLNVLSAFYDSIPEVPITGIYGPETSEAIRQFQITMGLPVTGIVNQQTWNVLYSTVIGILSILHPSEVFIPSIRFPGSVYSIDSEGEYAGVLILQELLLFISTVVPAIPSVEINGEFDPDTQSAVIAFQNIYGLEPTGIVDEITWNSIVQIYRDLRYITNRLAGQFPGLEIM